MLPIEVIECPYCGESIDLIIDDSAGNQQYVEDCFVCCRPINIDISVDEQSGIHVSYRTDTDT